MKRFIEPAGGLANRVRVVLTALRKFGPEITFVWRENKDCPCQWWELFQQPSIGTLPKPMEGTRVERTCSAYTGLDPEIYSALVPTKAISDSVDEFCEAHEKFDAIHVRRTDHEQIAKKKGMFTDDDEFFQFVKDSGKFFLACDDPATEAKFKLKFGDKCLTRKKEWKPDHRKTSGQDALIDLLICTRGKRFKGSGYSSFSEMIHLMRHE